MAAITPYSLTREQLPADVLSGTATTLVRYHIKGTPATAGDTCRLQDYDKGLVMGTSDIVGIDHTTLDSAPGTAATVTWTGLTVAFGNTGLHEVAVTARYV